MAVPRLSKQYPSSINGYLESNFQGILNEGLKELMNKMPPDPIKHLGQFLLANSLN